MAKSDKKTNALLDRIKKNSTLENVSVLAESKLLSSAKEDIITEIPLINAAMSGDMEVGMVPGILQIVGESRMFKTGFLMLMMRAFQRRFPNGIIIYYDSEFGAPQSYFEVFGIDMNRVLHCPITDVEMLKFDLAAQLNNIQAGDQVFIAIDSLGNLASKKEVEDAKEQKSVADMSRAKAMNSLFRILTPHVTLKSLYVVAINHGYKEIGMFPKTIVGGGTKSFLSSDNIWIIGREQEKDGKEVIGHTFLVKIEKSRYAREKLVVPVKVTHDGGIDRFSGLLELAETSGHVKRVKHSPKSYARVNVETGEIREEEVVEADTSSADFWGPVLDDQTFKDYVRDRFKVAHSQLLPDYEPTEGPTVGMKDE